MHVALTSDCVGAGAAPNERAQAAGLVLATDNELASGHMAKVSVLSWRSSRPCAPSEFANRQPALAVVDAKSVFDTFPRGQITPFKKKNQQFWLFFVKPEIRWLWQSSMCADCVCSVTAECVFVMAMVRFCVKNAIGHVS